MKPKNTKIHEARPSNSERIFMIPHIFHGGVMLNGLYPAGMSWLLFLAYLRRVVGPEKNDMLFVLVAVLGLVAVAGTVLLGRALWTCLADGVLTLGTDQVIWERRWKHWRSTRRLVTSEIDHSHLVVSRWVRSKKETLRGVEIKAGRRHIRLGWYLSWEEKYWLS